MKTIYIKPEWKLPPRKPLKNYLIDCDDFSVSEEVDTNKRRAIQKAKVMAKNANANARVLQCIDYTVSDNAPYYIVEPNGKVTERWV